tara:strand:- start:4957 stop:5559 length:603 start_codon:yes stop_codon:yes gene_type:complete
MADSKSFIQLLEQEKSINSLLNISSMTDEEKGELESIWDGLKSRQESKFDAIVSVIKECDRYITQLEREEKEVSNNINHWKKKRENVINIIKTAYEKQLISSKPTGSKYQATIKTVKSKLIANYEKWSRQEKEQYGLYKRTVVSRAIDNFILSQLEEDLPDKDQIRKVLEKDPKRAPKEARLVQRVSFTYGRRKRIKKGV